MLSYSSYQQILNISYAANKYIPEIYLFGSPIIVYVFPLPVYPYAKHVTFDLLNAYYTNGYTIY